LQILEHRLDELVRATRAIEILVPQDKGAAVLNASLLRNPECPRVSQV